MKTRTLIASSAVIAAHIGTVWSIGYFVGRPAPYKPVSEIIQASLIKLDAEPESLARAATTDTALPAQSQAPSPKPKSAQLSQRRRKSAAQTLPSEPPAAAATAVAVETPESIANAAPAAAEEAASARDEAPGYGTSTHASAGSGERQTRAPRSVGLAEVQCSSPDADYPALSRRQRQEARVLVRLLISEYGSVEQASLARPSDFPLLDEAALAAARRTRCKPYSENGETLKVVAIRPYHFSLD